MQLPLQVSFRNMDPSDILEANIREKAAKLDKFCDRIMSCRVMVEAPHKHHRKGNRYHVRIDLKVPNEEIAINREPSQHHSYTDVYVAVRDAFDAAKRKLEDYTERRKMHVKHHDVPPPGEVAELHMTEGYGRISTVDGRDIYFHRNSLINGDFEKLQVGVQVKYDEELGEEGPQASTVWVVNKHQGME